MRLGDRDGDRALRGIAALHPPAAKSRAGDAKERAGQSERES
jgi:hypothetical protein